MQKWQSDERVAILKGRTWHVGTTELINPDKLDGRETRPVYVGTLHAIPLGDGYVVGVALVSVDDVYVRKIGHAIARGRALKMAAIGMGLCKARIWTQWNPSAVTSGLLDEASFTARTDELRGLVEEKAEPAHLWAALQDFCRP